MERYYPNTQDPKRKKSFPLSRLPIFGRGRGICELWAGVALHMRPLDSKSLTAASSPFDLGPACDRAGLFAHKNQDPISRWPDRVAVPPLETPQERYCHGAFDRPTWSKESYRIFLFIQPQECLHKAVFLNACSTRKIAVIWTRGGPETRRLRE